MTSECKHHTQHSRRAHRADHAQHSMHSAHHSCIGELQLCTSAGSSGLIMTSQNNSYCLGVICITTEATIQDGAQHSCVLNTVALLWPRHQLQGWPHSLEFCRAPPAGAGGSVHRCCKYI